MGQRGRVRVRDPILGNLAEGGDVGRPGDEQNTGHGHWGSWTHKGKERRNSLVLSRQGPRSRKGTKAADASGKRRRRCWEEQEDREGGGGGGGGGGEGGEGEGGEGEGGEEEEEK